MRCVLSSSHTAMPSFRFAVVIAVALPGAIAWPNALVAQFPAEVTVGARVRAWVPEPYRQVDGPARRQLLRGTVQAVASDTLHLSVPGAAGTVAIPRASIRRLQVSRGASRPASAIERAAGVGAAWGAGIGAVTGALLPHEQWRRVRRRR